MMRYDLNALSHEKLKSQHCRVNFNFFFHFFRLFRRDEGVEDLSPSVQDERILYCAESWAESQQATESSTRSATALSPSVQKSTPPSDLLSLI